MKPSENVRVITHASEILTGIGVRQKDGRKPIEQDLGRITDGAIAYSSKTVSVEDPYSKQKIARVIPDKILWVGSSNSLPSEYQSAPTTDLGLKQAVIPGLVDCHTHLVFAGNRADEFARRCAGTTYAEIAREGGGIQKTVTATRDASEEKLFRLAKSRLDEAYSRGIRTIEIKSGYGLSVECELKILRVIRGLKAAFPDFTIVSTFLGAHDFPKEMSRDEYIREVTEKMIPKVAHENLADACDVFIDEGFYTLEEGRKILETAQKVGLKVKIHADELANTESTKLACDLGALSADHLLKISTQGIQALSKSETTAVLLPSTAFYLKTAQAPGRALLDAGARVAISTDYNPGTSVTLNLPATLTISALYQGLSRAELFAAVTYNAARALGLHSRKGTIEPGMDADVWVMPFRTFEECYYRFAW